MKLYFFPLLFKKDNIKTLDQLISNKGNLKDKDNLNLKKYYKSYNKRIDLLYDIYNSTKKSLSNIKKGIEYIHFTIKPLFPIEIPLEVILKHLIHQIIYH